MGVDLTDIADVKHLHVSGLRSLPELIGSTVVTPWFIVDEDRASMFERGTYLDSYPQPYEEEDGEAYGEGLVEGFHLLGLIDYLLNHVIHCDERVVPWNYGLDRVRFVSPVHLSDRFRLRGTLTGAEIRRGQGVLVALDLECEVEGRDRPGFVATQHALWVPLGAGKAEVRS